MSQDHSSKNPTSAECQAWREPSKQQIFDAFDGRISKMAIQPVDQGFGIFGRWARILPLPGNVWDVFVCNQADMVAGLSPRKVTAVMTGIADRLDPENAPHCPDFAEQTGGWRILDGEACSQYLSPAQILQVLSLLGIRRKKQVSEEQRKAASERFRKLREAKKVDERR